jgi:hypothetical protein
VFGYGMKDLQAPVSHGVSPRGCGRYSITFRRSMPAAGQISQGNRTNNNAI